MKISKKMGRPTDNPKPIQLNVRLDKETLEVLDSYCKKKSITRVEGAREAIKKLKE
jgi:Ribbon-helix-helix protein, copG family.